MRAPAGLRSPRILSAAAQTTTPIGRPPTISAPLKPTGADRGGATITPLARRGLYTPSITNITPVLDSRLVRPVTLPTSVQPQPLISTGGISTTLPAPRLCR